MKRSDKWMLSVFFVLACALSVEMPARLARMADVDVLPQSPLATALQMSHVPMDGVWSVDEHTLITGPRGCVAGVPQDGCDEGQNLLFWRIERGALDTFSGDVVLAGLTIGTRGVK